MNAQDCMVINIATQTSTMHFLQLQFDRTKEGFSHLLHLALTGHDYKLLSVINMLHLTIDS